MASQTANKKYQYDAIFHGHTLDFWVQEAHKANCRANNWKYTPLKRGAFGYDNILVSMFYLFDYLKHNGFENKDAMANAVHLGWCENYIYWRDNKPHKQFPDLYFAPAKSLSDKRRDLCAQQDYKDLPDDEKAKDHVFVNFVLSKLESH